MKIQKRKSDKHFRVAIFGSARIEKNDPHYNQIYILAKMISAEGIDVITGGGSGIMEAANKGHREGRKDKKAHSYGLRIKLPKEQRSNKHLDIKEEFNRFSNRLDYFMHLSNVVVVAPGGVGTLLEFIYTWQLIQVHQTCNIPIILMGKMWNPFIKWVEKWPLANNLISKEDMMPIFLADHCRDTMKIIKKAHEDFQNRGPDYCWNYTKYKID
jgi:uncharacterized protein (TIGR00730 family)